MAAPQPHPRHRTIFSGMTCGISTTSPRAAQAVPFFPAGFQDARNDLQARPLLPHNASRPGQRSQVIHKMMHICAGPVSRQTGITLPRQPSPACGLCQSVLCPGQNILGAFGIVLYIRSQPVISIYAPQWRHDILKMEQQPKFKAGNRYGHLEHSFF